jgi:hypothetical protein
MISSIYKEYNQIQRPDLDYGEERPFGQQKMTLRCQPCRTGLAMLVPARARVVEGTSDFPYRSALTGVSD